ncbi:MAG: Ldh family oxidoreductase [Bryobacteraceae bacterium]
MTASPTVVIEPQRLRAFAQEILEKGSVPANHAELVAQSLVASNLRGVDSHGVQLLVFYLDHIQLENMNVSTRGRIASENGSCVVYEGDNGMGQVVSEECVGHAIRVAKQSGISIVVARESNHFGAAAYWSQRIADAGFIGLSLCNATPLVAPWQGRDKRLGTNPICMAVPGARRWLLDMATTTVALNKVYRAMLSGKPEIPVGWALDIEGNPTTDTQKAMEGSPMPLGGYKGSGLAVMVEILCAVLSGGAITTDVGGTRVFNHPMRVSHFFMAIDVARFLPLAEFEERMERLAASLKDGQTAPGYDEVVIAGEPEWREEARRLREGIPLDEGVWKALVETAAKVGVEAPVL